jgi:DNA-binding PadR family transcriptional regulator
MKNAFELGGGEGMAANDALDPSIATELTDNEGSLLALVLRRQPVTAYQLLRIYEQSPVSSFNESKGSLYPLIRRMKQRGLLAARRVSGDGRNAELLTCTDAGRDAVRAWVSDIRPSHVLPDDPLRTKIISFGLLDPAQQRAWITRVRAAVEEKIEEVEAYTVGLDMPHQTLVHANAVGALRERIAWLDLLSRSVPNESA